MNVLPQNTIRRLNKIPQTNAVWEGDRRSISEMVAPMEGGQKDRNECIIWVDGSEGFVRAMDIVSPTMGLEAVVRTLIKAMENPHSPAKPSRPEKIVVADRQIQFYLRGILQELDINIEYVSELPLIDELWRNFDNAESSQSPSIGFHYQKLLNTVAMEIWEESPWEMLADHDILAVELNQEDTSTIYACVMGMLGKEYGIILYRSLESMKQFRQSVLAQESSAELEKAFLNQDCWFLNYELPSDEFEDEDDEDDDDYFDPSDYPVSEIQPLYGSLHPLEGMRLLGDTEEARIMYIALQALRNFWREYGDELEQEDIPPLSKKYIIDLPQEEGTQEHIKIKVSTMPELGRELFAMNELLLEDDDDEDEDDFTLPINTDLVPDGSLIALQTMPKENIQKLSDRLYPKGAKLLDKPSNNAELPVIIIQTSRPKAKSLLESIQSHKGIEEVCFGSVENHYDDVMYDLGIMKMGDGTLHLFQEWDSDEYSYRRTVENWFKVCKKSQGVCYVIIAMGAKGASAGQPQFSDMMGIFKSRFVET